MQVCFADLQKDLGKTVEEEFNGKYGEGSAKFVHCDVTKDEQVQSMSYYCKHVKFIIYVFAIV